MFQELQDAIVAFGKTIPQLRPVWDNILSRQESNLESEIEDDILTKLGLSVLVLYPFPVQVNNQVRGMACPKISVQIRFIEDVNTNQTGITCLQAVEYFCRAIQLWAPGTDGIDFNSLVLERENPWKDVPTIPLRNEIVANFFTAGTVAAIDTTLPAAPTNGNYRVQNSLLFQLVDVDEEDAVLDFVTLWAKEIGGVITPILADTGDTNPFAGAGNAPLVGSNYRVNAGGLQQLLNPATGYYHTLFVEQVNGVNSMVLDQTPDTTFVANNGPAPLAGGNYNIRNDADLELIGRDGLFYEIWIETIAGIKNLEVADIGLAA